MNHKFNLRGMQERFFGLAIFFILNQHCHPKQHCHPEPCSRLRSRIVSGPRCHKVPDQARDENKVPLAKDLK